jgi:hypothetical protein
VLNFVNPVRAGRRAVGGGRQTRLDETQNGRHSGGLYSPCPARNRIGQDRQPMTDHPHTSGRWDDATGENLVEQIAAVGDYTVALATYQAAVKRWPKDKITLRNRARVIERSWRTSRRDLIKLSLLVGCRYSHFGKSARNLAPLFFLWPAALCNQPPAAPLMQRACRVLSDRVGQPNHPV